MAPPGQKITVPTPTEKEIAAYPREYAIFRQLDHSHKGQIPLEVGFADAACSGTVSVFAVL